MTFGTVTLANGACLDGGCDSLGWWGAGLLIVVALAIIVEVLRHR